MPTQATPVCGVIDHLDFAVADLGRSRAFYERVLAPLGLAPLLEVRRGDGREGTGFGPADAHPQFWIGKGPALNGRLHVAFMAPTRAAVDAFHAAAIAAGAIDHGAPGPRPHYGEHCYAAFVLDPDGHVVEATCRQPVDAGPAA